MKKFITAAVLLLALTTTANATPIKTGITGTFGMTGEAYIKTDITGLITDIGFDPLETGSPKADDYFGRWGRGVDVDTEYTRNNPFNLATSFGKILFRIADTSNNLGNFFTFTADKVKSESANLVGGLYASSFYLIGNMSHADFITTESQFHFTSQGLKVGGNDKSTYSVTLTSPAPISEPGTLAIFGLALVGFAAANRKKKST